MTSAVPMQGLRAALTAQQPALGDLPLEPLADKGLAHWHVRIGGSGWLARLPKQSQMGLPAQANLDYQAACFQRAASSGHGPKLHAVLTPTPGLPRGGLLVEHVLGRAARLPTDLPALATALAALHALAVPAPRCRPPLLDPVDPLAAMAAEIDRQSRFFERAQLASRVRRRIDAEMERWQTLLAAPARPPKTLIAFDAHPGNFIVRADGRAVLVDLEKMRYGPAPFDLAHATLYTSTTWDVETCAELSVREVVDAYATWSAAMPDAEVHRHWFAPLRRAMWLWSISWCAMWRMQSGQAPGTGGDGADWSAARSESTLVAHVRDRVDHYLSADGVDRVCDEADTLARRWAD